MKLRIETEKNEHELYDVWAYANDALVWEDVNSQFHWPSTVTDD